MNFFPFKGLFVVLVYPRASKKDIAARRGLYCIHGDLKDKIADLQPKLDFVNGPLSTPIVSKDGHRCVT